MPFVGDSLNLTGAVGGMDSLYKIQPRDDIDIEVIFTGAFTADGLHPRALSLKQNYPNPFNPATEIRFALPKDSYMVLEIYNVSGQLVRTLIDEHQPAGHYRVMWNGNNDSGERVASGVYFYSLRTDEKTISRSMVLLK